MGARSIRGHGGDAVAIPNQAIGLAGCSTIGAHISDQRLCELRLRILLAYGRDAVTNIVCSVLGGRSPSEIGAIGVASIAVDMTAFHTGRTWTIGNFGNKTMEVNRDWSPILIAQTESDIISAPARFQFLGAIGRYERDNFAMQADEVIWEL
jgi:hypothetical protein